MTAAIKAVGLRKVYGSFIAVDDTSFDVEKGEIFGLLGPNGAGKTTTISMLVGLIPPTSGDAYVDGHSVKREPTEVRRRVGLLPENPGFYENLTARENLMLTAKLNDVPNPEERIEELIGRVGLSGWLDVEVGKFSRGMKQRLGIADALIKGPSVLIFDEPTAGVDPKGAEEMLEIISSLAKEEKITVLMSSHLLHQVERICDRIAVMNKGRIIAEGPLERLTGGRYILELEVDGDLNTIARKLQPLGRVRLEGRRIVVEAIRDMRKDAAQIVLEAGGIPLGMRFRRPSLAEIYRSILEAEVGT